MSKLFKLQEWRTIPDTARHLSDVFAEEVTERDVLRLGLDGHLTLSVNLVNGTSACLGKLVSREEARVNIFSRDIKDPMMRIARDSLGDMTVGQLEKAHAHLPEDVRRAIDNGSLRYVVTDNKLDDDNYIHLDASISSIRDIWDLPLIGSERLDVEHSFYQFNDGPEITGVNLEGTFVRRGNVIASLQSRFDSPDMHDYLKGFKKKIDEARAKSGKPKPPPKPPKSYNDPNNYFPAGKLPDDSILVVRASALTEFQSKMAEDSTASRPPKESTREKNTLLKIIGVMANDVYEKDIGKPSKLATSLAQKADELGITLGYETITKHLKAALQEIDKSR